MYVTVSDFMEQDDIQAVIQIFLIQPDRIGKYGNRQAAFVRQSVCGEKLSDFICTSLPCKSAVFCHAGDLVHADSVSLSMAFSLLMVILLNSVGQSVPEIQQHTFSGIKLVFLHDNAFDVHTPADDGRKDFFQILKRRM